MLARVAMPAVRQKRSKLAPTSCQASSMVATGTTAADVVGSFMALLSFVDSAPRAYRLKVGNACPPISTSNGTSPPVLLAREAATVDLLTDGRLQLGLGAGSLRSEYEQAGLDFNRGAVRVERLAEAIAIVKGLLRG